MNSFITLIKYFVTEQKYFGNVFIFVNTCLSLSVFCDSTPLQSCPETKGSKEELLFIFCRLLLDAVIIGASSTKQLIQNLKSTKNGPLHEGKVNCS